MEPVFVVGGARVFHGDCRDVLRELPDNSVDSIVTDPPYELGFMGKKWDSSGIAYDVTVWQECLRVLKPGGHLLAFGGSRTWHRLAVAIEDAGFELRDSIAWIYGSGFPKSLDISKAIDKSNGEGGRRFKFTKWMQTTGLTARQINEITGTLMGNHYTTHPTQPAIPTAEIWAVLRPHCGDVPAWVDELVARVEAEREVIGQGYRVDKKTSAVPISGATPDGHYDITAPATSEAKKWEGWGTALKPAFEPVVVGRKPLVGTVAENVLEWGVGGLNIDGSRIPPTGENMKRPNSFEKMNHGYQRPWMADEQKVAEHYERRELSERKSEALGRWPANVILDEVTAGLLDEQSGIQKDGVAVKRNATPGSIKSNTVYNGGWGNLTEDVTFGGSGGASRFFYVAKASKRDRNEGLEELEAKRHADWVVDDGPGGDNPRNRTNNPRQNFHPTVKPTQLMRYLIKLVTPPGGTVLDPFTGSGSTGKAALLDGFDFVGIELTDDYLPIIEGRLRWANEQGDDDERLF